MSLHYIIDFSASPLAIHRVGKYLTKSNLLLALIRNDINLKTVMTIYISR